MGRYTLLAADGTEEPSDVPGLLGGNRKLRIYGTLFCGTARAALDRGYAQHRVFFRDEGAAIAAGYRPCGNCMRARYRLWAAGGEPGTEAYPWLVAPKADGVVGPSTAPPVQGR